MSVEFRNSSCVVSWFSNTGCTFLAEKEAHKRKHQNWHKCGFSLRKCHKWWPHVQSVNTSVSPGVTVTVEHVRWPNNGALLTSHKASTPSWGCGSQPVVQVSTFHVFFRKANLNHLMLATCLLYRGLGHIEHSPTTAALASVRIYFGNFHLDRHML